MEGIQIKGVTKHFGAVQVLNDIDLTIERGEFVVFLGGSGCGKSTLLRMIAGLESITRGEIWIGGRRVDQLPPGERGVSMVFQSYALYPHMTVR
ncbi:MAG: ABC transporter ATP-binding protein, partial [Rhizobiaceae bacterium]|nr:ABC transporter ATP-binding protein [Rhizobiaceae bacterium]